MFSTMSSNYFASRITFLIIAALFFVQPVCAADSFSAQEDSSEPVNSGVSKKKFVDHGPAPKFIEPQIHVWYGGSMVTENYVSCFSEISQMNSNPGSNIGLGGVAVFGISDFIGLGTELNVTLSKYRTDFAVSNNTVTSVSNIFLRNRAWYINVPVYVQFRFNVDSRVRWNIDAGMYYSYGFSGSQSQSIYSAQINDLGQLISVKINSKPSYFNNSDTFINSYRRGDIGLHVATALTFSGKYSVGARLNFGFKNISYIMNNAWIVNPNIHNFNFAVVLGRTF